MRKRFLVAVSACALSVLVVVPSALAHDCFVAKKPANAGAVVLVNFATGEETSLKPNPGTEEKPHGAFVAFTDGELSASTFLHAPEGVLPPAREGGPQHNCDGKGLDSLELCFPEE
jgi:hypothetical protein